MIKRIYIYITLALFLMVQASCVQPKDTKGKGLSTSSLDLDSGAGSIDTTMSNLYEYRDIWAEESGGTNANTAEWSFGNGAVGTIGLPISTGWEVMEMHFDSDVFVANGTIQVDLIDMGNGTTTNTISSISLANSTDGGGQTNNTFKLQEYATPIPIGNTQTTKIGFITRGETGNISDARVGARLRRVVGQYVSDIN